MIEFIDYPIDEYKRQKFGRLWRLKSFFIIISPSAYTQWAAGRHAKHHHATCLCLIMAVRI